MPDNELGCLSTQLFLLALDSNDKILSLERLEATRDSFPANTHEVSIEEGSHAPLGDCGEQRGNGTTTISRDEQQRQCVEPIVKPLGE